MTDKMTSKELRQATACALECFSAGSETECFETLCDLGYDVDEAISLMKSHDPALFEQYDFRYNGELAGMA